jgi:hypothetical protein
VALSTAADYINNRVLRHACQLRPGYSASPELQADVLNEWAALYDEWNLDRNMPLTTPEFTYAITGSGYNGNNRDYKIGPTAGAGNFIGPRPVRILKANLIISSPTPNVRIPLAIIPWREYGSIPVLNLSPTAYTQCLYYEPAFPNGVVHFWEPINGQSIEIWQNGALVAPATLATVVAGTLAPGYENCIIYTLAERCQYLCTKEMGPRNPKIAAWALKARQRIQNANRQNPKCRSDFQNGRSGLGSYDPNVTYTGNPY